MNSDSNSDWKIGEFLVDNGIITKKHLEDALDLQKDNPGRLIGEILVTQGVLNKEDLVMAMELFLMMTDNQPKYVDEWLDQDEIDMLMSKNDSEDEKK